MEGVGKKILDMFVEKCNLDREFALILFTHYKNRE